jgi:hypothetical protein
VSFPHPFPVHLPTFALPAFSCTYSLTNPLPPRRPRRVLIAAQLLAERLDATAASSAPGSALSSRRPGTRAASAALGRRTGSAAAGPAPDGGAGAGGGSGHDFAAEVLRAGGHPLLAAEVELANAGRLLVGRNAAAAAAVFKEFEARETKLRRAGGWGYACCIRGVHEGRLDIETSCDCVAEGVGAASKWVAVRLWLRQPPTGQS